MILTRSLDFFILPAVTKLILAKAQFAREPVYILTPIPLPVEKLDDERERIIKLIRSYFGGHLFASFCRTIASWRPHFRSDNVF